MTDELKSEPTQRIETWQQASLTDVDGFDFESPIVDSKVADCLSLSLKFRDAAQSGAGLDGGPDQAAVRIFEMLWALLGMHARPGDSNEPYGPMSVLTSGRRSAIPTDFRGNVDVIAAMAERATNAVLRARLSDVCWLLERHRKLLGILAVSSYVEIVRSVEQHKLILPYQDDDADQLLTHNISETLQRGAQIAWATDWDEPAAVVLRSLVADLRKRALESKGAAVLWFSELDLNFAISSPESVGADIEKYLAGEDRNQNLDVGLWRLASRAYHMAKRTDDKNRCQGEAAECLVRESERQTSAMLAAHWLSSAISVFHGLPNKKERRAELRHRLIDIQARVPDEMSVFTQPLDLKEIAERVGQTINKATLLDKFLVLADMVQSPDPAELREDAIKMIAEHPLSSIFGVAHYDRDGKVVHRTQGGLGENEDAITQQIAQAEDLRRHWVALGQIEVARHAIIARHLISDDVLESLLKHSPFIPADLLRTYCRGFSRFFQGDFVGAVYTLIPLLENSLRHVLRNQDHDVSKFDDATQTQEDKTISALFGQMRSELEAIFTKPIIADLDRVFLMKPGPRLRHGVAHGLLHDGSVYSAAAIYGCGLIFRLCCLPLFAHRDGIEIIPA